MSRLPSLVRRHGFDLLIVIGAADAAAEVAAGDDSHWFAAPAVALLVLVLLGRRAFPFAAPAAVWILAPALSFVDGEVVVATFGAYAAGIAAAALLGHLADERQARLGLGIVVIGAAIIVGHKPEHIAGDFLFIPGMFAIAWLAGYALRARSAQAEAAEQRADQAERERAATARLAVAEERARIARELHDIVAHSVSVMVLQAGAVRHHLPAELDEDRQALQGIEHTGRTALGEMRQLLGAMRERRRRRRPRPPAGARRSRRPRRRGRPGRRARAAAPRGRPIRAAGRRPVRLSHRPGGADQLAQARPRRSRRRDRAART